MEVIFMDGKSFPSIIAHNVFDIKKTGGGVHYTVYGIVFMADSAHWLSLQVLPATFSLNRESGHAIHLRSSVHTARADVECHGQIHRTCTCWR